MTKEFIHYEESDFFSTKKDSRQERRLITKKDRSQYKKTDLGKTIKEDILEADLLSGRVSSVCGQDIFVDVDGKTLTCTLRGVFKKLTARQKNPLVVGDRVLLDKDHSIRKIEPRTTTLSRADNLSHQKEHLIAANIDQVLITVSVIDPPLRPPIIDRYLIAALKGNMHPIIVCNKVDLLHDPAFPEADYENALMQECRAIYANIDIPFIEVSTVTGEGIKKLRELMKDKTSVFSGQSGAGKSSLLNAIAGFDLKVGRTVAASRKGSHTTSQAQLLQLPFGGYVIDTPGIKSFGLWNVSQDEVRNLFPDLAEAGKKCKFQDCDHRGEAGCAIPEALEEGTVSPIRYESYLNLLGSIEAEHFRR